MDKKDNIFVKLQIEKDTQSGGLTLGIYFDRNAPNLSTEKDTISWSPTLEEIDFITETFEMISNCKSQYRQRDDNIKNIKTPFRSQKKIEEPPTVKTESKLDEFKSFETDEDAEETTFQPSTKPEDTEEKIFVQENEETIDEVLTRKKGEPVEEFVTDADEKTIIDKVLKSKIKNKK